jgi:hypothetical protein
MPDIDRLTAQLDDLVRKIDRSLDADLNKRVQRFHLEHDDGVDDGSGDNGSGDNGSVDDTWSEHADASADGNNADLEDDGDGYDGEEDDGSDLVAKASVNRFLRENNEDNRPGSLEHSSHTSSSNQRHKFEALALKVKNDNGIPMSTALAQARMQFPEVFADYQRWRRNGSNGIGKRAGPATFEDLVNAEMAKGLNAECAAQRVVQQHGFRALDHRSLSKREAVSVVAEDELMKRAEDIFQDDPTASRTDALRRARLASPRLMRALTR